MRRDKGCPTHVEEGKELRCHHRKEKKSTRMSYIFNVESDAKLFIEPVPRRTEDSAKTAARTVQPPINLKCDRNIHRTLMRSMTFCFLTGSDIPNPFPLGIHCSIPFFPQHRALYCAVTSSDLCPLLGPTFHGK